MLTNSCFFFCDYKYGQTTGGSIRQADPLFGEKQNLRCLTVIHLARNVTF